MHAHGLLVLLALLAGGACAQAPTPETPKDEPVVARTIALTVDDLPVGRRHALAHDQRVTRGLLAQIAQADVPAIGFVNEGKLDVAGERDAREAMLQAWVDAGHDLGNHTYDHPSLFNTPLAEFKDEVRRGNVVTNRLLAARGDSVRYFRHPFLNVGPDLETKRAFEAWLAAEGLTVAPVTHDNAEYVYALAYDRAQDAGDDALAARVADAYLAYMDTTAAYFEVLGRELFGRELAHVLLLHANALNADHLGRLVAVFRQRGYTFVTLDEALRDPVYASDDTYTGRAGMSWLQRWAITRGVPLTSEPHPDDWVEAIAYPNR
ncbi:polysaccharide deacetylase family protein [Rubrivirga sp. IMCC45206]|uniref:polysaccharide deacetylase family protein n=1 Tax=Rubrivirga sp. IMCC45206 TaxID=3391614 RepID=UPI00398FC260